MALIVKSNRNWRDFVYASDVPPKIMESQFDWMKKGEYLDGFFNYKGTWYHTADFMRIERPCGMGLPANTNWEGYHLDSFSTGVLIEISSDGEQYRVGYAVSVELDV